MKRIIGFFLFISVYSSAFSQKIICVERVTKSIYFYHRTVVNPPNTQKLELDIFDKGYSISIHDALNMSIDNIYRNLKYTQSDSVKYLTWKGDDVNSVRKYFADQDCVFLYQECINIDKYIKPLHFIKIKRLAKDDQSAKIGLSFVTAEWLHLKISDILASGGFNEPPTLHNPFADSKMFDIYLPLKIIKINNDVKLKHRFIVPMK